MERTMQEQAHHTGGAAASQGAETRASSLPIRNLSDHKPPDAAVGRLVAHYYLRRDALARQQAAMCELNVLPGKTELSSVLGMGGSVGRTALPRGSPKILIHTRQGRCVEIYCDQPARVLVVETQDDPRRATHPS